MRLVPDVHCHLDQLDDPERAVEEAAEAGVGPVLAVATGAASAEAILVLRDRMPELVLAGVGLHPSEIVKLSAEEERREMTRLEKLLPEADFIGEIGLDYKDAVTETERGRQKEAFVRQLEWAASHGLAVNLHSRRADRDVLEAAMAFRRASGRGALMHWFTHSRKMVRLCAQAGVFVSPGPSILIDPASADIAREIDYTVLLVETDSPVHYGSVGAARPSWAARVLGRLAEARGASADALAQVVRANFERYLGRAPASGASASMRSE